MRPGRKFLGKRILLDPLNPQPPGELQNWVALRERKVSDHALKKLTLSTRPGLRYLKVSSLSLNSNPDKCAQGAETLIEPKVTPKVT